MVVVAVVVTVVLVLVVVVVMVVAVTALWWCAGLLQRGDIRQALPLLEHVVSGVEIKFRRPSPQQFTG